MIPGRLRRERRLFARGKGEQEGGITVDMSDSQRHDV